MKGSGMGQESSQWIEEVVVGDERSSSVERGMLQIL